jgi:hypothetical protein
MATEKYTPAYETTDADLGSLLKFLFWLTVSVVITFFGTYAMLRAMQEVPAIGERPAHPLAVLNDPIPPAPNLEMKKGVKQGWDGRTIDQSQRQPFTTRMWSDMKVDAQKQLHSYGWIDESGKVVHIPIERAMELALQKGYPVQQPPKD